MRLAPLLLLLLLGPALRAQEPRRFVPVDHVQALSFAPDGETLLAGHERGRIVTWDVRRGREAFAIAASGSIDVHHGPVNAIAHVGSLVLVGGVEGLLLDPPGEEARRLPGAGLVRALAVSPDGATLALLSVGDEGGERVTRARLLPLRAGAILEVVPLDVGEEARSLAWSPDGSTLAVPVRENEIGYVRLWNRRTGATAALPVDGWSPTVVAFARDGLHLLAGTGGGEVVRFEVATRAATRSTPEPERDDLHDPSRSLCALALSPDGTLVATCSAQGVVRLLDARTLAEVRTLEGREGADALAFSPDGTTLAAGTRSGAVLLFDVSSPRTR